MKIEKIVAIAGKPGLYEVLSKGKNSIIVEALEDKKRIPVTSLQNISALSDIAIYTFEEEVPLRQVLKNIYDKENGGKTIDFKSDKSALVKYFGEVLPNFDEERVYPSNIKKVLQWYTILHAAGFDFSTILEEDKEEKEF